MSDFHHDWQVFHGDSLPLGHRLADMPGWNLTQFNFLPGNGTVAPNHNALRGMLGRYDAMARRVLGEGEPCYLVLLRTANEDDVSRGRMNRLAARHGVTYSTTFQSTFDDKLIYAVFAGDTAWTPGRFTRELLAIYQRRIWNLLWMNKATGAVYQPFDAGATVSAPTPRALLDIVQDYYGWLPVKGEGYIHLDPAHVGDEPLTVSKACSTAIAQAVTKESAGQTSSSP